MKKSCMAMVAAAIFAAVFHLGAVTPLEQTQANVQFNLALNLYKLGKLDDSASTLHKALAVVPEHPQANLLLGIIANQQGHFKDALAPLKNATRLLPTNPDAFNNYGVACFQVSEWSDAEAAFSRLLQLQPERTDALMNLGVLGLKQKKWKLAQSSFAKAAKADPKSAKAWLGLAEASEGAADSAQQLEALGKALELTPGDRGLRLGLAQKLYRNDKNDQAEKLLDDLKDKGDSEAEFLLGCILYRKAHFDESRERFETALKARPDYPEARFNLAITLYDQNKYGEALAQFEEVLKKHPKDDQARNNLEITRRAAVRGYLKAGSQDFLQGEYLAAIDKWREALKLEPTNKVIKDLVDTAQTQLKLQAVELAGKGDLAYQAGKTEDAVQDWGQALERDPDCPEAKAGMEKLKPEAKKLIEIYSKDFNRLLAEGDLSRAGLTAKRLNALDSGKGKAALKSWEGKRDIRAAELAKASDQAAQKGAWLEVVEKLEAAVALKKDDPGLGLRLNQAKVSLRTEIGRAMAAAKEAEAKPNLPKALKEYRRVLELEPINSEAQVAAQRLAKAVKASSSDPAELDEWYYQGVYAYAAGETSKAMTFWRKVLESNPNHRLANEAVSRANKRLQALKNVK